MTSGPLTRCAVWGTGRMGAELTRAALAGTVVMPVAAIVTDPDKDGRDLGTIAGLSEELGVRATLDADAVLARDDVDLVFLCGQAPSGKVAEATRRAILAGKDVIAFSGLVHAPTAIGAVAAAELDDLARSHGRRVLATGFAPGYLTDVLPVALARLCVTWTTITARIVFPMDDWGAMTLDAWGIGKPPGQHTNPASRLSFAESVGVIAESLGVRGQTSSDVQPIVSDRRREGRRVVQPGTTTGLRRRYALDTDDGRTIAVEVVALYAIDEALDGEREQYVIEIEGGPDSGVTATLSGGWTPDPYPATAATALNAVRPLLALRPGLYNPAQIPLVTPRAA